MNRFPYLFLGLLLIGFLLGAATVDWWRLKQPRNPLSPNPIPLWKSLFQKERETYRATIDAGDNPLVKAPPLSRGPGFPRQHEPQTVHQYRKQWAIIIGNNAYPNSGDLSFAYNDARDFRQLLIDDFGYHPSQMLYLAALNPDEPAAHANGLPTLKGIRGAFEEWLPSQDLHEDDCILVFFAGHGFIDANDEGWLAPIYGNENDLANTCYRFSNLKRALEESPSIPCRHKLVILDCCYSGSLFKGRGDFPNEKISDNPTKLDNPTATPHPHKLVAVRGGRTNNNSRSTLSTYFSEKAFLGISAGRHTPVADGDSLNAHSVFTKTLLDVMKERANTLHSNRAFTFRQMAAQVEGRVASAKGSFQVPDSGRLGPGEGDFVFQVAKLPDLNHTPRELALVRRGNVLLRAATENQFSSDGLLYAGMALGDTESPSSPSIEFPPLFDPHRDLISYHQALNRVALPRAYPFFWSSQIASHHSMRISCLAKDSEGNFLASGAHDGTIGLWDLASGKEIFRFRSDRPFGSVYSVSFSPDGRLLASGHSDGRITIWNTIEKIKEADLTGHSSAVYTVAFHPEGRILASGSQDNYIRLWDLSSKREVGALHGESTFGTRGGVLTLAFGSEGNRIVSGTNFGKIKLWDFARRKLIREIPVETDVVNCLAISPDGKTLATGHGELAAGPERRDFLRLWDLEQGARITTLTGHVDEVVSVAFHTDGNTLASGGTDGTVRIWDVAQKIEKAKFEGHTGLVSSLVFTDNKTLFSSSHDCSIKRWSLESLTEIPNELDGHADAVNEVAFSQNGEFIASGSDDGTVKIWDFKNSLTLEVQLEGDFKSVHSLAIHPNGKHVVTCQSDKDGFEFSAKVWDLASNTEIRTLPFEDSFSNSDIHSAGGLIRPQVTYSESGKLIIASSADNEVYLWDAESGERKGKFEHSSDVASIAVSPDETMLSVGLSDNSIQIWSLLTFKEENQLNGHDDPVLGVEYSPNGMLLASGSSDKTVKIWDATSGVLLKTLEGHDSAVWQVTFNPDSRSIASASDDSTIKLWSFDSGEVTATLSGHSKTVKSIAFSPDGRWLVSASADHTVKLWPVRATRENTVFCSCSSAVSDLAVSPDGSILATVADSGFVNLWDPKTSRFLGQLSGHRAPVLAVAFSSDGEIIATGSRDKTVRIWEVSTQKEKAVLKGHTDEVRGVAFCPRKGILASGSRDRSVKVWNVNTGELVKDFAEQSDAVGSVSFSPDGTYLAAGLTDNPDHDLSMMAGKWIPRQGTDAIMLWESENWKQAPGLKGSSFWAPFAFSPDGNVLARGSFNVIKLWDLKKGAEITSLSGHSLPVTCVAFSRDGQELVSGSKDGTLKLWDLATFKEKMSINNGPRSTPLASLMGVHIGEVLSLALSPNGDALVSGSSDGTVRIWRRPKTIDPLSYSKEEWIELDPVSNRIVWQEPRRGLFHTLPFRAQSWIESVDLLLPDPDDPKANSAHNYLQFHSALGARNFPASRYWHGKLSAEQKSIRSGGLEVAIRNLSIDLANLIEKERYTLAENRLDAGLEFMVDEKFRVRTFPLLVRDAFKRKDLSSHDMKQLVQSMPEPLREIVGAAMIASAVGRSDEITEAISLLSLNSEATVSLLETDRLSSLIGSAINDEDFPADLGFVLNQEMLNRIKQGHVIQTKKSRLGFYGTELAWHYIEAGRFTDSIKYSKAVIATFEAENIQLDSNIESLNEILSLRNSILRTGTFADRELASDDEALALRALFECLKKVKGLLPRERD